MTMKKIRLVCAAAFAAACFSLVGGLTSNAAGAPAVLWQIGQEDRGFGEFAIAGKYNEYQGKFPQENILFEIGKSDPAKDWPYIQPGTADSWAGGRPHPRTIRFTLAEEPRGMFRLRVALVDAQSSMPPVLTLAIRGQEGRFPLASGAGDGSLADSKAGKPQIVETLVSASLLAKGVNEWVLSSDSGSSWLLYDAVTLFNEKGASPEPAITHLTAEPTPLFVKRNGAIGRLVEVELAVSDNSAAPTLRAVIGGDTSDIPVPSLPPIGTARLELVVPDSDQELSVSLTASLGSRTRTAVARVEPARKWTLYIAAAAHNDVGYTDAQPKTIELHNRNTDRAVELAKRYPDYRWNLEVALQAETYLAARDGQRREDFLRLAREGRIGVMALYANMLTGLCSHEEACRMFQVAADLRRLEGIPCRTAMLTDVPTAEASFPMIAANSGIRFVAQGINNGRAPTFRPYAKSPCWWEGPDGSRVLMAFSETYGLARSWGVCTSVSRARIELKNKLAAFEKRADYPYDAVFVHGQEGDNTGLDSKIAEVAREWNERYAFPKIVLSSGPEFFEHIEKHYGDKLPVIKGSAGTYWEDGAGTTAHETAISRAAHENLGDAERLFALAQRIQSDNGAYPQREIESAWRNVLLYDEHTWGASESISRPEAANVREQWKNKARFAVDAGKQSLDLLDRGMRAMAARIRTTEQSLVVFNASGWKRSEIVLVPLPKGLAIAEPDVPTCETENGVYAWVRDVPSCGYRILKVGPAAKQTTAQAAEGATLDSRTYRIRFDEVSGAISSILDKESGRELVDSKAAYKLNQYLYVAGGKGTRIEYDDKNIPSSLAISTAVNVKLRKMTLGALGEMMIVESSATMTPRITSVVIAWNDVKRIDIDNRLDKTLTYDKEAGYFAFPFAVEKPAFRYEVPAGIVNANTDMLPGACLDWFTVQHFVEVAGKGGAVVWATPDAPLACFQDINRGLWQTCLAMANGHIYGYVFNNYWWTNYRAGQDGELRFRFAITSRTDSDLAASARFGAGVSSPLRVAIVGANPDGPMAAPGGSLMSIAEPNAQLVAIRQAADGKGSIVRLWETCGMETTVHLNVKALGAVKASACNLVEEGAVPLELKDGVVSVPLRARGLATVRLY
jgi:hypothetical protein